MTPEAAILTAIHALNEAAIKNPDGAIEEVSVTISASCLNSLLAGARIAYRLRKTAPEAVMAAIEEYQAQLQTVIDSGDA